MKKIFLISFLFSNCVAIKKLPEICAERFPVDIVDVLIVDTIINIDTSYIKDTINKTDTIKITMEKEYTKIQVVESTAKLEAQKKQHQKEIKKYNTALNNQADLIQGLHSEINELKNKNQELQQDVKDVKKYKLLFFFTLLIFVSHFVFSYKWYKFP